MKPIDELIWNVNYARKDQIERLNKHLDGGKEINTFLHDACEWQLASLIRDCRRLIPQIEEDLKEKPKKRLFWKK